MTAYRKKFIQVNIYDRTLEELRNQGISLKTVLKNIGCSKVWIAEGSVHESEWTDSDSDEDPVPHLPRFSTPKTSRHVTMDINLSTIHPDDDDEDVERVYSEDTIHYASDALGVDLDEEIVRNLVEKLVNKVHNEMEIQKFKTNRIFRSTSSSSTSSKKSMKRRRSEPDVNSNKRTGDRELTVSRKISSTGHIDNGQSFHYNDDNDDFIQQSMNETMEIAMFTPPPPNVLPSGSILKPNGRSTLVKKAVSFKATNTFSMFPQINEMDEIDDDSTDVDDQGKTMDKKSSIAIKCEFPECRKTIKWRTKFGKIRLLDHVLLHGNSRIIRCQYCTFRARTTRHLRCHYRYYHQGVQLQKYGIKQLMIPDETVKLWSKCFKNSIHLIGSLKSNRRICRALVKTVAETSVHCDEERIEEPDKERRLFRRIL